MLGFFVPIKIKIILVVLMNRTKIHLKAYNQGEISLFPCRLDEKISSISPVRLVNTIIDQLDLTPVLSLYPGGGSSNYHPRMLLKVLFYGYMNNLYSCRKLEKALQENIHYMWLSGNQSPSFNTINRFRSERLKDSINQLFVQVITLLVEMGQLTLDIQYIDGTKIESISNKYSFVWKKSVEKNKEKLTKKIRNILTQIDAGIAQDNQPCQEEPFLPLDSVGLQARIEALNQTNRERSKPEKKQLKELEKHKAKLEEYEYHLSTLGKRNSYSKTDKDATFMRMKEDAMNNGQTKPGYNVQIGTENQYITNIGLYPNPTDTTTLPSMLTLTQARLGKMPAIICADAGYGSEENYELMDKLDIKAFVKYNYFHKEQHRPFKNNPFLQGNLYYNGQENYFVCPMGQHLQYIGKKKNTTDNGYKSEISLYRAKNCEGCPLRSKCYKAKGNRTIQVNHKLNAYKRKARELLLSEEGLRHRRTRPVEPEAVFGQMKFNKGYKRFRHRGYEKVYMDFVLFAMAFNVQKLFRRTAADMKRDSFLLILCEEYKYQCWEKKILTSYYKVA